MKPNERGWRREEGESEREDVLYTWRLYTAGTRGKGGCEEMWGGIARASGCIEFKGKRNSGPEAGFDKVAVPNRGPDD